MNAPENIIPFPAEKGRWLPMGLGKATPDKKREALRQRVIAAAEDRNTTIAALRAALKETTGRAWSVTGGRGTAWGWITVTAPATRCTWKRTLPAGSADLPENYEWTDGHGPGNYPGPEDLETMRRIFQDGHHQGHGIAASQAHRRLAIARALTGGDDLGFNAENYWD